MAREKMSSVDTAWLRMDRPSNLMQILGVMVFDKPLDLQRLRDTLQIRMIDRYPRFRQRVTQTFTACYWEDDDDFNINHHVHPVTLPGKGDLDALKAHVADLASEPLNPNRPLWEMQVIQTPAGVNAMAVRIHHCIADGIALIGVILSLTDERADAPLGLPHPSKRKPHIEAHDDDQFWWKVFSPATEAWLNSLSVGSKLWFGYLDLLMNPGKAVSHARMGAAFAGELAKLALMPNDSPTRFKGKAGVAKSVAWSEPMPLPTIKAVGKVLGCSINDLLLASVAGALRSYLQERGDEVDGVELRAMVPVNLRPAGQASKLGNHFGLVALELPVGVENPLERLYDTKRRMEALKHSYQAAVAFALLGVAGMAPKIVQQEALDLLANKASAVMTNVPGPQNPLFLAGSGVSQLMVWVPQSGNIGMGVSILSYNGNVQFGLITDHKHCPDPENIIKRFSGEFEKLMWLVLMEPWDRLEHPHEVEQHIKAELGEH
ncbi:wax ester/triacylglycerol synthase family O-acyltransferase [Niveibacterium sp. 24ML]|uniref:wax ester/triacylglycerol synthase family O-acyltransferase n=1 Tax=Niveibacterium sp. 24ML TaxID=2985512 RepID=UPI0022711C68|nr:wax ester/triacylglycerol synthase family O-acyltransferase [Niveibacterium sp. 24ML]MCX9155233.1 wax ester/triacylglycerol synthase family O-acyltransferase [Niveibacterium sp. 24ML]